MRFAELSTVQRWLPTHPLSADPIWQRQSHALSEGDIMLFYARAGVERRQDATEAIDALQAAVIMSAFEGELKEPPAALVMHEPPHDPYFVDELIDSLVKLRPARRQAVLLALETHTPTKNISELTWKTALNMNQVTPLAREVLSAAIGIRHLKLPYVFWEWSTPNIASPLLGLQRSVEKAFDCKWPELARKYRQIIHINRRADSTSLMRLVSCR